MGAQGTRQEWSLLTSKWKLHPAPQWGWGNIGTGGGETGVRCPSLRWAAGQGPVLVGTIGSQAQLGCWGGAGLLGCGDARQRDTPGQRGCGGLSWGQWSGQG